MQMNVWKPNRHLNNALFGGLFLYIVGFLLGDDLLAWLFTRGGQVSFAQLSGEANAAYFCLTISIKGLLLWFYHRWAFKHGLEHITTAFSKKTAAVSIISLILFVILDFAFPGFKSNLMSTWNYFNLLYGLPLGLLNTVLQYIYYVFEGLTMIWIADAFQTAGETRWSKSIPFGGIALGLLWGSSHIFGKGWFTALTWALPFGLAVGALYVFDKKNFWTPFLFWMIFNVV